MKLAKGIILMIIAAAALYFTVWDFDWKCEGLSFCFLLIYLGSAVTGVYELKKATHTLPDFFYEDDRYAD